MEFILKQRLKTQIEYECINIKYRWKGCERKKMFVSGDAFANFCFV